LILLKLMPLKIHFLSGIFTIEATILVSRLLM
jgi:hypothetical protein